MLRNYFTIALRVLAKNRTNTLINFAGLSLSIAASVFLGEYVSFERSANSFHANIQNLYRVLAERSGKSSFDVAPGIGPLAKQVFPEVAGYCRIAEGMTNGVVSLERKKVNASPTAFRETKIAMVDGSFFSLFSFQITQGDGSSLSHTNTAALSISRARAYFGSTEVVGRTITVNNQFGRQSYKITAVFRDMPANSDLKYDLLLSLKTLENKSNLNGNTWAALDGFDNGFIQTFLQVRSGANASSLDTKLAAAVKSRQHDKLTVTVLQPVASMHLSNTLDNSHATYGNVKFVWLISATGVLILIIAWFNFLNLSSAQNIKRGKEIGIRKLIGAEKRHIIRQYLIECLLLFTGSLVMAILVCITLQPYYNRLIDRPLSLTDLLSRGFIGYFTLMFAGGSILASVYGSVSLASFKPAETIKGKVSDPLRSKLLNNTLVVFQFSLAIVLITATLVLSRQLTFMENKDLGMDLEHLIVIGAPEVLEKDKTPSTQRANFENGLSQLPFVTAFCSSGSVPGNFYNFNTSGIARPNSQPADLKKTYSMIFSDSRYFDTYGIAFAAGHNFTRSDCAVNYEKSLKVIVNESAVHNLGFRNANEALGKQYFGVSTLKLRVLLKTTIINL